MSDEELVKRLQKGDRAAFDALYTRYRNDALRTASLITGSRADGEDVVQEAFVQCYRQIGQLRDPARFKSWLWTLMTRAAWKYCRRRGREEPVAEFFEDGTKTGESALGTVLRTEQSQAAVSGGAGARRKTAHGHGAVLLQRYEHPGDRTSVGMPGGNGQIQTVCRAAQFAEGNEHEWLGGTV